MIPNSDSTVVFKCLPSWVFPRPHMAKKSSNKIWWHFPACTILVCEIPDSQESSDSMHCHLLLVSFIHVPKHWCFFLATFSSVSFHYLLYDYHTHFGCNIHKGHFISFNAVPFSNMDMILGEFPQICTIIPYSVSFSPVFKSSNSSVVLSVTVLYLMRVGLTRRFCLKLWLVIFNRQSHWTKSQPWLFCRNCSDILIQRRRSGSYVIEEGDNP